LFHGNLNLTSSFFHSTKHTQSAVIGGAVAAAVVVIVVVLALLLLRVRRRRRQWDVSGQFLVEESPAPQAKAVEDRVPAAAAPQSDPSITKGGHSYSDSVGTTAAMSEISADTDATSETLAQRIRRMEAQMETLLTLGVPNTAPPVYVV
jgi:hypothetical protein